MSNKSRYLDIDYLRTNHQMIHYFGLGFIQLKLDWSTRVHFYTKELPAIVSEEDIHNHRYDFCSMILKGSLAQDLYQIVPGNTYVLEKESCTVGVPVEDEPVLCGVRFLGSFSLKEGSDYYLTDGTFHRVSSVDCITLVSRSSYTKTFAEVVRPVGALKVCPFSQRIDEKRLWEIVEEMINSHP